MRVTLKSLREASKSADLCVVATQADNRLQMFREITEVVDCKNFLLEKIVSQFCKGI